MTLGIVMHFYNEEFLLPFWIEHHKLLADKVIFINHHSTDNSLNIIKKNAPDHWDIVTSKLDSFDAKKNDIEVTEYEKTLNTDLKIILNTTEFLFTTKQDLDNWFIKFGKQKIANVRSVAMIDNHFITEEKPKIFNKFLWKNITYGYIPSIDPPYDRSSRFLHSCDVISYDIGRHGIVTSDSLVSYNDSIIETNNMFILWFAYAPWPYVLERKLQIQHRIPETDRNLGLGCHHFTDFQEQNYAHKTRVNYAKNLLENIEYYNIYKKLLEIIK